MFEWVFSAFLAIMLLSLGATLIGAVLAYSIFEKMLNHLICFSIGALLSTALLHLLPEAIELAQDEKIETKVVFICFLLGIFFFFLLERFSLDHHHHCHESSDLPKPSHSHVSRLKLGLMFWGSLIHGITDGVLIAASFLINPALGWLTTISLATHEMPNRLSFFIVLSHAGETKRKAVYQNLLSMLGPIFGLVLVLSVSVELMQHLLPIILGFSASGFVYIAMSDLIPKVQHKPKQSLLWVDVLLIFLGVAMVVFLAYLTGAHH